MEFFDIVDENGNPTGETISRAEAHQKGVRHRTAHIWIVRNNNGTNQVLLQKRAMIKDSFPGRFDTSSAGHIMAGDEIVESALRELEEELGISANENDLHYIDKFKIEYQKEFNGKLFCDNEIAFVFIYNGEVDINSLKLQEEEIESVEWFDLEPTFNECLNHNQKFCVPIEGFKIIKNYINNK